MTTTFHDMRDFPVLSGKVSGVLQFTRDFLQDLYADNQHPSKAAMQFLIEQLSEGLQFNEDLFTTVQNYRKLGRVSFYKFQNA